MGNSKLRIWLTPAANSPYWLIRWKDPESGRTMQRSTGTKAKKDAERMLGEFRAELLSGRYLGPNNTLWSSFRERYEAEAVPGLARRTAEKIDTVLDAAERVIAPQKLSDLTASRLSKFVAELRDGTRTENTILGYLAHLRSALSWAVNVGLLTVMPKFPKVKRAKSLKKPKGRAPTEEEFNQILDATAAVVGDERAASWRFFLQGLWWSGLRLGEALETWWDREDRLRIDFRDGRPVLHIPAELEKGHQDRAMPVAPEFAEFLLQVPSEKRTGRVFNPEAERVCGEKLTLDRVSRIVTEIGKNAGIVVHVEPKSGKKKYASCHDFRRAFGDRWALRVMPPVLMQLMRHESIETTMKYYVGRNVDATTKVLWEAYENAVTAKKGGAGKGVRDTLRDTGENGGRASKEPSDAKDGANGSSGDLSK